MAKTDYVEFFRVFVWWVYVEMVDSYWVDLQPCLTSCPVISDLVMRGNIWESLALCDHLTKWLLIRGKLMRRYMGVHTEQRDLWETHLKKYGRVDVPRTLKSYIWPSNAKQCYRVLYTRDWHFGFETSRFRNFCQFFEGIGFGFGKFGIGKKVSVSVSENLVSEKKSRYRFRKIWYRKKVSVSVSENLVSEKKSRYRFRSKFWYRHSVLGCKPLFNCWVIYYHILTARVIKS